MNPEKYINEYGKECFRGVTEDTPFSPDMFHESKIRYDNGDKQVCLFTNIGNLTVLDRMTGLGFRDIETGYRDMDQKFWLASGGFDVRESGCKTMGEAIEWVKANANNCRGI